MVFSTHSIDWAGLAGDCEWAIHRKSGQGPDVTLMVEIRSIRGKGISTQRRMSRPSWGKYP